MVKSFLVPLLLMLFYVGHSQKLLRSTFGMAGSSQIVQTSNHAYYISQSIGQSSAIGTFSAGSKTVLQGFQQPPARLKLGPTIKKLDALIYPNPTSLAINIDFNERLTSVDIQLSDHTGRLLFQTSQNGSESIRIGLEPYSSGVYILKIVSEDKYLYTSVIKL